MLKSDALLKILQSISVHFPRKNVTDNSFIPAGV